MCGHKMYLRFCETVPTPVEKLGIEKAVNIVCMKCPQCARVERFYVEDKPKYLKKVLEMRGNRIHYHPTFNEWSSMDDAIKKKLESLGYWG